MVDQCRRATEPDIERPRVSLDERAIALRNAPVDVGFQRPPVERLIDRRIGLDDLVAAFDRLRAGDGLRQVIVFD